MLLLVICVAPWQETFADARDWDGVVGWLGECVGGVGGGKGNRGQCLFHPSPNISCLLILLCFIDDVFAFFHKPIEY